MGWLSLECGEGSEIQLELDRRVIEWILQNTLQAHKISKNSNEPQGQREIFPNLHLIFFFHIQNTVMLVTILNTNNENVTNISKLSTSIPVAKIRHQYLNSVRNLVGELFELTTNRKTILFLKMFLVHSDVAKVSVSFGQWRESSSRSTFITPSSRCSVVLGSRNIC